MRHDDVTAINVHKEVYRISRLSAVCITFPSIYQTLSSLYNFSRYISTQIRDVSSLEFEYAQIQPTIPIFYFVNIQDIISKMYIVPIVPKGRSDEVLKNNNVVMYANTMIQYPGCTICIVLPKLKLCQ